MSEKIMKIEETGILTSFKNFLVSNKIKPGGDNNILCIFGLTIDAMVDFLKHSKHNAETTILKIENSNSEFVMAMEVTLTDNEDGNKSWNISSIFNKDDLDIPEGAKVYTNNDSVYLMSFKNTAKSIIRNDLEIAPEHLNLLSCGTIEHIIQWANDYHANYENIQEFSITLENIAEFEFSVNEEKKLDVSLNLHQQLKQRLKSDGKSDLLSEDEE